MASPFRVLFVCTGNVCRSPMAQAMLTHHLRSQLGARADELFEVTSAGTGALAGEPMEPFALDALAAVGIEPDEFIARDATVDIIESADLILTATKRHRSLVVSECPSVVRRAFTIKEFARLARSLDRLTVAGGDLVATVAEQRGLIPAVPAAEDDVADPYRQPAVRFTQTAAELRPAVDAIAHVLAQSVSN